MSHQEFLPISTAVQSLQQKKKKGCGVYRNGKELRDKGFGGEAGRGILWPFMCICIKPVQSSHVQFLSH